MSSYEDKGRVLSHWPDRAKPNELLFETKFVRPDRFRFEYTSHHPYPPLRHLTNTHTLWSKDGVTKLFWTGDSKVEDVSSVERGIGSLVGVSRRSSYYVPSLLLPTKRKPSDRSGWKLMGTADVAGAPCYHLRVEHDRGVVELWIGTSDFLFRKIVETNEATERLPSIRTEVLYEWIARNKSIADSEFTFVPPQTGKSPQKEQSRKVPVQPSIILKDARARAKREGKATVVEFGASWCGPCHYFGKYVAIGAAVRIAQSDVVFLSIECDTPATEPVCRQYNVDGYPTFVVLDVDGTELSRRVGLDGLQSPQQFVTFLHTARDAVLTEAAMLKQLHADDAASQVKAAQWYTRRDKGEKAAEHYALAAALDPDNAKGLGAEAAWKALEWSHGRTRALRTTEAFADFVARFPGTEPATDALIYAALSGTLAAQRTASLLSLHGKRLQNAGHLENVGYLALELGLVEEAQAIADRLAMEFGEREVHELQAALALAHGDMKSARGFYALCVAKSVYKKSGSAECELLGQSIESGEEGPKRKALLRFARSFFANLKSPGQSGDDERTQLRREEFLAKHAGHGHGSSPEPKPPSRVRRRLTGETKEELASIRPEQRSKEGEEEASVPYRAIVIARRESELLERTMLGLRGYVPWSKSEENVIPSLILQGDIGRYGDNGFAFDASALIGPSIKTGSAFLGIFGGVGGSGAGNALPSGFHIPVEIALAIDSDEYEGDVWLRSRKLFNSRRDGADNGPLDELSIGFGVQLFPAKEHGLMLGLLYEELLEQTSATLWIGTRLTKPGGGW